MAKLKNGKILEWYVSRVIREQGGSAVGEGGDARAMLNIVYGPVGFTHTNEAHTRAKYDVRDSQGNRLGLGRGEKIFDAMATVAVAGGFLRDSYPVSLKGGDSRDLTTDVPLARAIVEAGLALWVWCLEGDAPDAGREVFPGEVATVADPTGVTVRRINVTPFLRDTMTDWDMGPRAGRAAFVRANKVGKYVYPRLRVSWKDVPARYWQDEAPIPLAQAFTEISVDEAVNRAVTAR